MDICIDRLYNEDDHICLVRPRWTLAPKCPWPPTGVFQQDIKYGDPAKISKKCLKDNFGNDWVASWEPRLQSIYAAVTLNLRSSFFVFIFIQNNILLSENKDCSVHNKNIETCCICFLHRRMEGRCKQRTCSWFNSKDPTAAWIKIAYHSSKYRNSWVKIIKLWEKKRNLLS